jgi:hypothetical protein
MPETNGTAPANGHAPELEAPNPALDALLLGLFEPTAYTLAPGRVLEVRPLLLGQADELYAGTLRGVALQRYLLARCVYAAGRPIGERGVDSLPVKLANDLAAIVMAANGMAAETGAAAGEGGPIDPLS